MRWIPALVLVLICAALILWGLGGGGPREDDPAQKSVGPGLPAAGPRDTAQLCGPSVDQAPAHPPVPAAGAAPTPATPPPDWPHGTITGRIVGPGGEALPDSRASAIGARGAYGAEVTYREGTADASGRFVLHVRAGLSTVVVARARGHGLVVGPRIQLEAGATRDVGTLQLSPEQRLLVRVVDGHDAPVEDVRVHLDTDSASQPEGWEAALVASKLLTPRSTDAEGRALFDMLPAGTWRVSIDTGATQTFDQVRERVGPDSREVLFVVPSRAAPTALRLSVNILGPDGEPVPRAHIRLESESSSLLEPYEAGQTGPLELREVLGPVRLIVEQARDKDGQLLGYGVVVIPDVRGRKSPIEVHLGRGAAITGRIAWAGAPATWLVEASGHYDPGRGLCVPAAPRADTHVWLRFRAQAESDGTFCLVGLPPGSFHIHASGPGRPRGPGPIVEAGATDVVLEMVPQGQLEVQVLAPRGLAFKWAALRLEEWVGGGLKSCRSWEGGGGKLPHRRVFKAPGLRQGGRYRLSAWGYCSGVRCRAKVLDQVVPREEPYVLQLIQDPHVRGVVEREDGTPVCGAEVRYRPWPGGEFSRNAPVDGRWLGVARTDPEGVFKLSVSGQQEILLGVGALGLALRDPPARVLPGAGGIRLVVVPEQRISGRIVDPAGGGLDRLRVVAVPNLGRPRLWTAHQVAADGFFEVRGLAAGSYRVMVWNERDPTDTRTALSSPMPAGQRGVRLELRPGAVLEGVIRDADQRPLRAVRVQLLGLWTNRSTRTNRAGQYAFAGVPEDVELELKVVTASGESGLGTVRILQTAQPTTLDMTLPKR